ncbi:(Fe-S)-binding protein [Maridesulfovibrio bastinii]|uniref:(Fe-S)-binding protein n=1 Tax=Maridesulfovibrio bastinii TaxID=47157 RepID=UPI00040F7D64|nr:(Fe-S)-binding protein [Maridesulfovibrio bastinii]
MKKKPGSCVQCGKCLEVCPLFKATGREELAPRSKFFLQSLDDEEGLSEKDFNALASLCLSCGRCAENCPQNMSGADFVSGLRSDSGGFLRSCWNLWLKSPGLMWPLASALSHLSSSRMPGAFGSARRKMDALFADSPEPWAALDVEKKFEGRKAVLFPGCVARYSRKDWTQKAEKFMNDLGFDILDYSGFTCCGSSMGSAGLLDVQNRARINNIRFWKDSGMPVLVTICATCLKGLADYSPDDFESDADYENWQNSLKPLSALLIGSAVKYGENAPEKVVYHHPCHAPENDSDELLVQQIAGERLSPVRKDLCCGFGGVMQLGAPELSRTVGRHCLNELLGDGSEKPQILSGCSACVIQLASLTDKDIFAGHWLDILN